MVATRPFGCLVMAIILLSILLCSQFRILFSNSPFSMQSRRERQFPASTFPLSNEPSQKRPPRHNLTLGENVDQIQQGLSYHKGVSNSNEITISSPPVTNGTVGNWSKYFQGESFMDYKLRIDTMISRERSLRRKRHEKMNLKLQQRHTCKLPPYRGEFGYTLACMVPWAYAMTRKCTRVESKDTNGTKYLFYFSDHHEIDTMATRVAVNLPAGNPLNRSSPHFHDKQFPNGTDWVPPPFKTFFRPNVTMRSSNKPLVIISNKYQAEFEDQVPTNHLPNTTLYNILQHLNSRNYQVIYNRLESVQLLTGHDRQWSDGYNDKDMIRNHFPSTILMEDLVMNLDADDSNLMLMAVYSLSDRFISVQGGNAVLASFFGGTNLIYALRGKELKNHGFTYYYRFSNASILYTTHRKAAELFARRYVRRSFQ